MKYTVVWTPAAEQALAKLWTESANRTEITNSANAIDTLLRSNPEIVGESRADEKRLLYVAPLAIYYDVSEHDRRVRVWAVWQHPKKRS